MITCVYCGATVAYRSSEGDHVVPAAFGHFMRELHFYRICRECNSKLGKKEEKLLRCTPEALIRNMIQPVTSRRRGQSFGRGAGGKPGPRTVIERDGFELLAWWDTDDRKSLTCPEQIVLKDKEGRFYHLLLFPSLSVEGLRKKVESIGVPLDDEGYLSCDEANSDAYLKLFAEVRPKAKYHPRESRGIGEHRVDASTLFVIDEDYYRVIAKIAFHYYLVNSPRGYRGDEPQFQPIREFVMGAGSKESFFVEPTKFRTPFAKLRTGVLGPSNWSHVLAGEESRAGATISVTLFVGPEYIPPTHELKLAHLDSKVLVPEPSFGHVYEYFRVQAGRAYAGRVKVTPPIRLR